MQALADTLGLFAPLAGQAGHHLQAGRRRRSTQAQLGGRPGKAGEQQCVGLGLGHAGELRAPTLAQLKTTMPPAFAPQRHARRRELIDVAQHGALRDLHGLRKRARRQTAARLQQHQDGEQSAGFHGPPI
ncbi:hypothetical protein D9M68_791080 [compost metagenome]